MSKGRDMQGQGIRKIRDIPPIPKVDPSRPVMIKGDPKPRRPIGNKLR